MPTVIDQFVIELGLDPKKFTQGQRDAIAAFKRTQEEATTRAKAIEAAGQRAGQFFTRLRNEALGFFALLVGGRELKAFVEHVTAADAAASRLGRSINVSATEISAWGNAARLFGGSAEGMASSFRGFSDSMQELQATGESDLVPTLYAIGRAGGKLIDVNKPLHEIFLDIADDLAVLNKRDPAQAHWLGRRLGLDEGMINILVRGRAATRGVLDEVNRLNPLTEAQAKNAENLAKSWQEASIAAEGLGRSLLSTLTPQFTSLMKVVTDGLGKVRAYVENAKSVGNDLPWYKIFGEQRSSGSATSGASGGSSSTGGGALRKKAGAGDVSVGALALAQVLQSSIPELREFTAFNDAYHGGQGGHGAGRALDFTVSDPSKYADVAAKVRSLLGPGFTVIDENANPSGRSTGSHIHVQANDAASLQRFNELTSGVRRTSGGIVNKNLTSSREVHVGTINVTTSDTDSASSVAKGIYGALEDVSFTANADYGAM